MSNKPDTINSLTEDTAELLMANKELAFQNGEKEKRAAELVIANKELFFQNKEKEKRAAELHLANVELLFQNEEKEKRAAELVIANKELFFQNDEKEKRAAELHVANVELLFQNKEKEKKAAELIVANDELAFQNGEKEKRAAELVIANKELFFQNDEKEKRAAELHVANEELLFQNKEKEKKAAELVIANEELLFQNAEKEKRAAELIVANEELLFQNEEKEKRAAELAIANKELESFIYIASHDMQEPLRKIQIFANRILEGDQELSPSNQGYFQRMQATAHRMKQLIEDLLTYTHVGNSEKKFERTDLGTIIDDIKNDLKDNLEERNATITVIGLCEMDIIAFQFRQLLYNLVSNALKFASPLRPLQIVINSKIVKGSTINNEQVVAGKKYCHLSISDNGIGFDPLYRERIFEVFQKLHTKQEFEGTGIGLAIVKKIVDNHAGIITATGELGKGVTFDMYIPVKKELPVSL